MTKQIYLKTKTGIVIPVKLSAVQFGNNGRVELINDFLGLSLVGNIDDLHAALTDAADHVARRTVAQIIDFETARAKLTGKQGSADSPKNDLSPKQVQSPQNSTERL